MRTRSRRPRLRGLRRLRKLSDFGVYVMGQGLCVPRSERQTPGKSSGHAARGATSRSIFLRRLRSATSRS
jgi:hypothetical protein